MDLIFDPANGGLVVDADASLSGVGFTYDWAWGDGTDDDTTEVAQHTYAEPGTYTITLTVTDDLSVTTITTRSVFVSFSGLATNQASPRPIYLGLEDGSGDLLLEGGDGKLLLEESAQQLVWADLNSDGDWGRRDAFSLDLFSTICAQPTMAAYLRIVIDTCPNSTCVVGQVYIDSSAGVNRAPTDLTSNVSSPTLTVSTSTSDELAWQAFDGVLANGPTLSPGDYLQLSSACCIGGHRVGIFWGSETLYASEWHLEISDDGVTYREVGSVDTGTAAAGFNRTNVTPADPGRVTSAFRYWRITSTSDAGVPEISALEFRNDGVPVSPSNMTSDALPSPYVASASSEAVLDAFNAFDGTASVWSGSTGVAGEYLQIDLGSSLFANEVSITQPGSYQPAWSILGSADGVTFVAVAVIPEGSTGTYSALWPNYLNTNSAYYSTLLRSIGAQDFYFPFGEDGATDMSGNGHDWATYSGTATVGGLPATLTSGASVTSDAADTILTMATYLPITNSFSERSYSLWFRAPVGAALSGDKLLYKEGDATNGVSVYLLDDVLGAGFWAASGPTPIDLSSLTIVPGQWYHIVSVFSYGWQYLYVNGELKGFQKGDATMVANHTNGGVSPVSLFGAVSNGRTSSGTIAGPGGYCGEGFEIGEVSMYPGQMTPSDVMMLYLTGRTTNSLNRQDDVIFASDNPGGTVDATTQSQHAAMTSFYNQSTSDTAVAVQKVATISVQTTDTPSSLAESNTIESTGQVVVGHGATLGMNNSEAGDWLDGRLTLMGRLQIQRGGTTSFRGAGDIQIAGDEAVMSLSTTDVDTPLINIEVPFQDGGALGTKITIGGVTSPASDDSLFVFDQRLGAGLFVRGMDITGGARVRWLKFDDADSTLSDGAHILNGLLEWDGLDGPHGTSWGPITVDPAGEMRWGTSSTDVPEWDIDLVLNGGGVAFREFSGSSTLAFQAGCSWTMVADTTIEVEMTADDPQAVAWGGDNWSGASQVAFSMLGTGGFSYTSAVDPAWGSASVTSDAVEYTDTNKVVGFIYAAALDEPAGLKTREFGKGTLTLNSAIFWLGHGLDGATEALSLSTPVIVNDYAELNLDRSYGAANPVATFTGDWTLNGRAWVYYALGGAVAHSWESTITVGQLETSERRFTYEGVSGSDVGLCCVADGVGTSSNSIELQLRNSDAGQMLLDGTISAAVTKLYDDSSTSVFNLDGLVVNGDLTNATGEVLITGTVTISGAYLQDVNAQAILDMNSGGVMKVGTNFFVDLGTVVNLAGSEFEAGTWETLEVDMVGASEWSVVSSLSKPLFRGPATLTWSNATGSIEEGEIVLPDGVDGGDNTFWLVNVNIDSPHIWVPEGGALSTSYDLRWVQSYNIQDGYAHLSFWGDSTPRIHENSTLFQAAWNTSRINDPRLPWMGTLTSGSAVLTIGGSSWNLLLVDNWYPLAEDEDKLGVRFCGVQAESGGHSADGMEPVVVFDREVFETAMNSFTMSSFTTEAL